METNPHPPPNQIMTFLSSLAHQAPLSMGFSRQEHWSGLPCSPPGDLPNPRIEPASPMAPELQVDSLPTETPGKPFRGVKYFNSQQPCMRVPAGSSPSH